MLVDESILGKKLVKAVKKTMGNGGKSSAMLEDEGILGKKLVKAIKDHGQWQQIIGNTRRWKHSW